LIESGSTRKYLLYAIGEISLVVIGILIALQINNWNEWRKDRILEQEILTDLLETTREIQAKMIFHIGWNDSIIESIEILDFHFKQDLPFHDSLKKHIHVSLLPFWLRYGTWTFDAIVNTHFDKIGSKQIKKSIAKIYSDDIPQLITHSDKLGMLSDQDYAYIKSNFKIIRNMDKYEYIPVDYNKLKHDQYYRSMLINKHRRHDDSISQLIQPLERCEALIQMLERELED